MLGCLIIAIADAIVVPAPKDVAVDRETALIAVKRTFNEEGELFPMRDYYLIETNDSAQWTFFVDALPGAGWEHESFIASVPKVANSRLLLFLSASLDSINCPPDDEMTLVAEHAGLRYDTAQKPFVSYGELSQEEAEAANRTYAIILNGGINKNANHERYWNDCSFIYQTLVKKLGVPRTNISVIMADGADPAEDMRHYGEGEYLSSPLDLDFDGLPDIQYSATKENIRNVFSQLETKMEVDDHLFFFVVGGGGRLDTNDNSSYIRLWGEEKLSVFTLSQWLKPLLEKSITFNAVLGQSYGSSMSNVLSSPGCVQVSAKNASGITYACHNKPYSEFLYWWTSAINKAEADGISVASDLNGDGVVSMSEAAEFVKSKVSTVQYASNPTYLGNELSFSALAETTNLYIKDNFADDGTEPNPADAYWDSPSIWVRNHDDGIEKHEPVSYAANGSKAFVYVKIHNRGKEVVGGTGRYLDVYWAFASTTVDNKTWLGNEAYTSYQTGGHIGRADIGAIAPGDSSIVKIEWQLPLNPYREAGNLQFCIGVKMDGKTAPALGLSTINNQRPFIDPIQQRCHALKSVSVVTSANSLKGEMTFVRSISLTNQAYSLSLCPRTARDSSLLSSANVELVFDPALFALWKQGGRQKIGISETTAEAGMPSTFRIISPNNRLGGIVYENNQIGALKFIIRYPLTGSTPNVYAFDLIQRDSRNNIVGATAFISQGAVSASPAMTPSAQSLENEHGIASLTPAASVGDVLAVRLKTPAPENAALAVTSVLDGTSGSVTPLQIAEESADIQVGNLKPGVYAVTYTIDGLPIDTAKFTKR